MSEPHPPHVLHNRFAQDAVGASAIRPSETCFRDPNEPVRFHGEPQDTSLPGWRRLVELIDEAATDRREDFRPLVDLSPAERQDLVTLPPSIARLTRVKRLALYGSPLVRIPPEIGAMESIERFEPYTSYSLHWFPYELTRCRNLRDSTVSTRALYGNVKFRPPFLRRRPRGALAEVADRDRLDPGVWGIGDPGLQRLLRSDRLGPVPPGVDLAVGGDGCTAAAGQRVLDRVCPGASGAGRGLPRRSASGRPIDRWVIA